VFGGVLFAQSTQATAETQEFPPGAAILIPPHSRIIADVHLVNAGDDPITVPLELTLHTIGQKQVTALMSAMTMQNFAIALPPQQQSSFVVECDLTPRWNDLYAMGQVSSPTPDFKIYHALAHYHKLGTGLTMEAIRDSDGAADPFWSTTHLIGDEMGGLLDPPFDMTGYSKIRLTCNYDNTEATTIRWGNANGEMCVGFAYTDSTYKWTAGLDAYSDDPGSPVSVNGVTTFTAPSCTVIPVDNAH
jgi:hypothetical protein